MLVVREPAVAGRFYPAEPRALEAVVRAHLAAGPAGEERALAVMAPHAGYVYSGAIAGATYAAVKVPDRVVLMCPNHTGRGARKSVSDAAAWRLPGGDVPVDAELRQLLVEHARLELDSSAHAYEHAAEVHVPFVRAKNGGVSIVPICLGGLAFAECRDLGRGLARAILEKFPDDPRSVLIVASTDMSHYVPAEIARELDSLALDRVLSLDPEGLYRVVRQNDISMCGVLPVTVALVAALELGGRHVRLVRYGNSGEVSGDSDRVVGYAGAVIY